MITIEKIDPFDPDLEPLADLLADLPGPRVNQSTVWRWKSKGRRGYRLPYITIGPVDYSHREIFAEWLRLSSQPKSTRKAEVVA